MSSRKPDIILEVDGQRYGGWKSIDISRGLEQCAGTFRLSVTDRWPQQNEPRGIKAGAACRVPTTAGASSRACGVEGESPRSL